VADRDPGLSGPAPRRLLWGHRVGIVVAIWLLSWGYFVLDDGEVLQPVLLAIVVIAAAGVVWGGQALALLTDSTDWTPGYVSSTAAGTHDPRFSRLSRLLTEASDRVVVWDEIHRTLRAVTEERLQRLHGIDLATQSDRARQVLGEELFTYVSTPARRPRGDQAAHLSRLISRIEAI
jgi:hypothetical protein